MSLICILHGYLLEGSGSNLWTRSVVRSLCTKGETVHLVCQEGKPELFDFISDVFHHSDGGDVSHAFTREVGYEGRCIMHRPMLGDTLPVYVWDQYEDFRNVVPMVELSDDAINDYLRLNTDVVTSVVRNYGISAMLANHAVLMSVVAHRVSEATSVPFAVMPHGSAIEYAVKKDERFLDLSTTAFSAASRIFVIGEEMRERIKKVYSSVVGIDTKMFDLPLGVDTGMFEMVPRRGRDKAVSRLIGRLAGMPRGKTPELTSGMCARLTGDMTPGELESALSSASSYNAKLPDADVEVKLKGMDWAGDGDRIILFVGRIIPAKGLQSLIMAMPLILSMHPDTRLLAVGHGPMREPLEAVVWALGQGKRSVVERVVGMHTELQDIREFLDRLEVLDEKDAFYEKAEEHLRPDRVVFTGYLTHSELRYLFPCCDAAVFPSLVREAGPLVFLEALASGCFPLGTYFGGMAASIDSAAVLMSEDDADLMKLNPDRDRLVEDICKKVDGVLELGGKYRQPLRDLAVECYDWTNVSRRLALEMGLFK